MKKSSNFLTYRLTVISFIIFLFSGCSKFVEVDAPINQLPAGSTFSNDLTATSAIAGIYSRLSQSPLVQSITPYTGLYSDEIINYSPGLQSEFAASKLSRSSSPIINANFWNTSYQFIYACNVAIEQLEMSSSISRNTKDILTGEARFLRAYIYLNLTGLFGDVPMPTASNYELNSNLARTERSEIRKLIISDLAQAAELLPEKVDPEKIRANRWAAKALLARAYYYDQQFALAEVAASEVIASNRYQLNSDPTKVFLKNSTEAILQLYPTQTNQNTPDGLTFLPATATETPKYYLNSSLVNEIETGDLRGSAWIASRQFAGQTLYYPNKYKVLNSSNLTEYLMIVRLAELYLIRAGANLHLGEIGKGVTDLNVLRKRSRMSPTAAVPNPVPDIPLAIDQTAALRALEHERRVELMFEIGHRWFDLTYSKRSSAVLSVLKPSTWQETAQLWPLPEEQLRLNPNLIQNSGYFK